MSIHIPTVLIVSERGDIHAEAMELVLVREFHVRTYYLSMREFPKFSKATFSSSKQSFCYEGPQGSLDSDDLIAIWWRRPEQCQIPTSLDKEQQNFMQLENDQFLQALLWMNNVLWVNDPSKNLFASRKVFQLNRAKAAGLSVPDTIVTNDPEQALAFYQGLHGQRCIYKRTGSGPGKACRTTLVDGDCLSRLDSIACSPTTFQKYIEPEADIRVVWIDGHAWAVLIDTKQSSVPEDCRFDLSVPHVPYELPSSVKNALDRLMQDLGLKYGAIDLRVGTDGLFYFLEVNPSGQFLYLEIKTGQPILNSLASLLVSGKNHQHNSGKDVTKLVERASSSHRDAGPQHVIAATR